MAKFNYNPKLDVSKFEKWLKNQGVEILPCSSEYEILRFKGKDTGILYSSGACGNNYTKEATDCFMQNKAWNGKPVNIGRNNSYKKEKIKLLERDGSNCFYCGLPLEDDVTLEHLISLSSGGPNTLANMVLAHEACNQAVDNKPLVEKINYAVSQRVIFEIHNNKEIPF